MLDTIYAWFAFIAIIALVVWAFVTLFWGAVKLFLRIDNFLQVQQYPPWIGQPEDLEVGRNCPSCFQPTLVVKQDDGRDAMVCGNCCAYGVVWEGMIEWTTPSGDIIVETLDPSHGGRA